MIDEKLKIGNLKLKNPFFLAPMEAVNCTSFRLLCKKRGASLVYTDMIDVDSFLEYKSKYSTERAIEKFINPIAEEKPLAIQLGGSKIKNILEVLNMIEPIADLIDFNAGCPLPYMLGKKGGAYLVKHPEQLYKIVKEMRNKTDKPLNVKIRSGWDENSINAIFISKELENIKVDAIAIHPRTRKQGYRDKADWQLVRKIKDSSKIPIILSGDVTNVYMAKMALLHTKVDFIMIARGAKNNPSIFYELKEFYKKFKNNKNINIQKPGTLYNKKKSNAKKDFLEFLELYRKHEKRYNLSEIKDHALWSIREIKKSSILKSKIIESKTEKEIIKIFKGL